MEAKLMSENVHLTKKTLMRIPQIQQGLIDGNSYEQIAAACGVTEKTIYRDMQAWVNSGSFETWLKTEFASLYAHVRVSNPVAAYKELAKIVAKMVTQKREITEDITLKHITVYAEWSNKPVESQLPQTTTNPTKVK